MKRTHYDEKINTLLQESDTYLLRAKDTTKKIQNKVSSLVKKWEQNNYVNEFTAKDLRVSNAFPSRLYGLPKIHKDGMPLRPIVSYVGSPTYYLATFIKNIISKNARAPTSRVLNSFELVKGLRRLTVPNNHVLVSFDIVALFTNVPKENGAIAIKNR